MPEVRVSSEYVDGDRRVELEWTLEDLARRLEPVTGIPPEAQRLEFRTEAGSAVAAPAAGATLGELGVAAGWHIRVLDTRPSGERLDLSGVAGPGMSLEEYARRPDTLLQWKREHHLGRFDESRRPAAAQAPADAGELAVPVGSECFVRLASQKVVRGTVAFYGPVAVLPPGPWVGVVLVSADGLNDGSVKGVRLFEAAPGHGVVVRASAVRPLDADEEEF